MMKCERLFKGWVLLGEAALFDPWLAASPGRSIAALWMTAVGWHWFNAEHLLTGNFIQFDICSMSLQVPRYRSG